MSKTRPKRGIHPAENRLGKGSEKEGERERETCSKDKDNPELNYAKSLIRDLAVVIKAFWKINLVLSLGQGQYCYQGCSVYLLTRNKYKITPILLKPQLLALTNVQMNNKNQAKGVANVCAEALVFVSTKKIEADRQENHHRRTF